MTSAELVRDWLPWLMSAVTLYMTFLQGRKTWVAWAVGLGNQVLWLWYALSTQTWGFLPLNLGLWYLYVRNLQLWRADERRAQLQRLSELAALEQPKRWFDTTDELRARPRVKQP